jgi:hypothetical protein
MWARCPRDVVIVLKGQTEPAFRVCQCLVTVKARLSRSWITHFRFRATFSKAAPTAPPRNIRMNVVAPGAAKTPIWKRGPCAATSADESAKLAKFFSSAVPLARWGEAKDVANAVLFFSSDDSSYVCKRNGIGRDS